MIVENDPLVKRWLGSYPYNTSRTYLLLLRDALGDDAPESLLRMDEAVRERVVARARSARDAGKSNWGSKMLTAVKSFCLANGGSVEWRRNERIRIVAKKILVQHVPTRSEVYRMADVGGIRGRALILCLYQSGVRAGCLSHWDMRLVGKVLDHDCPVPFPLKITREYDSKISSYGLSYYYTFLGAEAVEALRDHMNYRIRRGWKPSPEDSVWGHQQFPAKNTRPTRTGGINVWKQVKNVVEKAGLPRESVWTHTLRKSFQKALNASTIDEDTRESLMGHVLPGSRGNYFDYHDIEEIRGKYGRVPLGREDSSQVSGLREMVDKMHVENQDLKVDLSLALARNNQVMDQRKGFDDERDRKIKELEEKVNDFKDYALNLQRIVEARAGGELTLGGNDTKNSGKKKS